MMAEQTSRSQRRWFLTGCVLTGLATLALVLVTVLPAALPLGDTGILSVVCGLAVLMGLGATMTVFNLRRT